MKIYELNFGEDLILPEIDTDIRGLCRTANEIKDGYVFFDLPSATGIDKVYEFKTLPVAIVTESKERFFELDIPLIKTKNARRAYSYAYSSFLKINFAKLKIIGVTGTNGKSSTTGIIKELLCAQGKRCGLIGTGIIEADGETLSGRYYSMTTPDAEILYPAISKMQKLGIEYIVMEVSSHALALNKCEPIEFEIAVFTGLSHEHLDFHKDMNEYYSAKKRLFEKAKRAIIFTDNDYGKSLFSEFKERSVSAGITTGIIRAEDILERGFFGNLFTLSAFDEKYRVSIKLPGVYNIQNSLLSLCVIIELSLDLKKAIKDINNIEFIKGRFEVIQGDVTVIRDFAHTEFALNNLLKTVKQNVISGQSLSVVLGCGGERDKLKRPMMAKCASNYADRLIITEDNSRGEELKNILSDIIMGAESAQVGIIADRALAIEYAISSSKRGDTIVIVGKGAEDYIIEKQTYRHFDERKIIEEALKKRITD